MTDDTNQVTRRTMLKGAGAAGAAGMMGLAGCTGGGGGGNKTSTKPLEVLHGWTGGDGKKAVQNLVSVFKEEYPDMKTDFKPIGGGGNTNLNTVVANRLSNNNPPGSFAGWPGKNLVKYEGVLGDLTEVWKNGLEGPMVKEAAQLCKYNGKYRAVPIGSHRLNCLFYNTSVVEAAGVDPANLTSASKLIDALDTIKQNTDKVPMAHAMKGPWTTLQLVAAVLLSTAGYQGYMTVVNGEGGKEHVRTAFETTKTILQNYINDDASSIGFTTANQKIMAGDAAFIHQGNWAAGAFRNKKNFAYNEDWGFKTFPGTENMYTLHFDSFIYPGNNPTSEKSKTWSKFVGSKKAQVAFNKYKGSIPTRTDVSKDEFGPYLKETIDDFAAAKHRPPTLAHGLAVVPEKLTSLKGVISNEFSGPYNVDKATEKFVSTIQG